VQKGGGGSSDVYLTINARGGKRKNLKAHNKSQYTRVLSAYEERKGTRSALKEGRRLEKKRSTGREKRARGPGYQERLLRTARKESFGFTILQEGGTQGKSNWQGGRDRKTTKIQERRTTIILMKG